MPIQGPQAHSRSRAPEERMSASAPERTSSDSTLSEPGDTDRSVPSATLFPRRIAATLRRSASDELVQEPMHT